MDGFNGQILVDKIAKLNSSQQSIETLSHWCIFHRHKCKQIVDIWEQQFYCGPLDRRVPLLYLANDILQNSRRKGVDYVTEFWRVIPDALNDVVKSKDDSGIKVVFRLLDIWEERKVFGSRGQALKDDLLNKVLSNRNRDGKRMTYLLNLPGDEILQKIISSYEHVCSIPAGEDSLLQKCQSAISYVDKIGREFKVGSTGGSEVAGELQVQHGTLRDCIEQLRAAELSRSSLIACLQEALHLQEGKIERVRSQLQVLQPHYEESLNLCQKMGLKDSKQVSANQGPNDSSSAFSSANLETSSAVMSKMSLDGGTQVSRQDYSAEHKRPRTDNGVQAYVPQVEAQPPLPPFPHPDEQLPPPPPIYPSSPQSAPNIQVPPSLPLAPPISPLSMPLMFPPPPGMLNPLPPLPPSGLSFGYGSPPPFPPPPNFAMPGLPPFGGPPVNGPLSAYPSSAAAPDGGPMNVKSNVYPDYGASEGGQAPLPPNRQ